MTRDTAAQNAVIRQRICPNCQAQPGQPCTQPTDTGRKPVNWFHYARENLPGVDNQDDL